MTSPSRTSRRLERWARVLTWTYASAATLGLLLWLLLRWEARRPTWIELVYGVLNVPLSHSLVSFVVLALITQALIGRKQVGLIAAAAFQILGMYLGVVALARLTVEPVLSQWGSRRLLSHWLDVASLIVGCLILAGLWLLRPAFPGHLQRGSWIGLAAALAIGAALTLTTTWVLLSIVDRSQDAQWRQLASALVWSLGDLDARRELIGIPPWIPQLTSVMVSVTLVSAVALFLRSAPHRTRWSGSREIAIRKLLAEYGDADSLGYFATRRDKSSIFSPDRKAAVSYRVASGVSLASGDPVGDPAAWPHAIREWKSEARYYGWLPAVVSASEAGARAYADAGLNVMPMGDEAILAVDRFALANTSLSEVRHAARRAQRAGITVEINRQSQLSAAELAELTATASQWRAGETDRGFSMALNRPADPADSQVIIVAARDGGGRLNGLLTFVPWGRRGVSLDVMRRSPQAPNGITELMVTEVMAAASSLGIREVSLNFCMFRGVYADAARLGAGSLTRLNYSLLGVLDRFWQLERLYRATQKYDPYWRPRYLCYDGLIALPAIALATAIVEGFLPQPRLRARAQLAALTAEELDQIRALDTESALTISPATPRWSDQTRSRLDHLRALATSGHDPYPIGASGPDTTLAALDLVLAADPGSLSSLGSFRVAGRIQAIRDHGGVVFCTLTDAGKTAQVLLDAATVGEHDLRDFARLIDIGDLVLLTAHLGSSRNGTPTLIARSWQLAAKSLHPIPFRGLTDQETRLRQRSLDLLVHPEGTQLLHHRSSVIQTLRRTLENEGFLEVETPILHTVHGGASARPFRTYSNAYGIDLCLRIAPELHLKRLLVAGLGAVFEIGRNFRNEGADSTHNPEFTSLEAYQPYADYTTMRHLTERLVTAAATSVHGRPAIALPRGGGDVQLTDITPPWPVVPVLEAVSDAVGTAITLDMDFDELVNIAWQHGVDIHGDMGPGAIIEELYAERVEPCTIRPTFYTDFPRETSPLAGAHRRCPGLVERWDLVINRMEVGTAYSELTDPVEQRHRLTEQSLKAAAGDPDAMELDEEFLAALEIGMPPTGGLGIGVDRLAMVITNRDIRSVLSFPFVRPKRLH